jgi:biotin carboxyl carrier protein
MPARAQSSNTDRTESEWALQTQRDHEAIARLADDLLPALIAKLAASGLGEIEVRQGGWKARLSMPAKAEEPKASAKAAESHGGRGRSVAHRSDERQLRPEAEPAEDTGKVAAKSPAVGIYQPRKDLAVGMRVRSGDKIGTVNVLGVNQDVVSPVEGIIGSSLAEAGEAVEYGQELIRIELPEPASTTGIAGQEREPAAVAGKA